MITWEICRLKIFGRLLKFLELKNIESFLRKSRMTSGKSEFYVHLYSGSINIF